ncbi:MAG TPA: hypothetical protein VKF63_01235 [Terracidiphilus sp.]|nr:hypothetical protein [Terracidiphilus sp.]
MGQASKTAKPLRGQKREITHYREVNKLVAASGIYVVYWLNTEKQMLIVGYAGRETR